VDAPPPTPSPPKATVEYISLLSHVLMTPLAGIVLWCDMLLRKGDLPERATRGLVAIDRGARAQVAILDNLLELSRLQSGSTELERSLVDLATCIDDVLARNASAATQRQVALVFDRPTGACSVRGDPVRLRTAIHNLVDNAINASPPGCRAEVTIEDVASGFSVRVSDEGGGVAADSLPGLVSLGAPTGAGLPRRRGGLGLGLPIARRIAELHGGALSVTPRSPRGSRFALDLPRA
jgi:signal transduction histidine kinase